MNIRTIAIAAAVTTAAVLVPATSATAAPAPTGWRGTQYAYQIMDDIMYEASYSKASAYCGYWRARPIRVINIIYRNTPGYVSWSDARRGVSRAMSEWCY